MSDWNAAQYLRFADQRTRPCRDLAARVAVEAPASVIDLGCGPGNSTAVLAGRWPAAAITGIDNSEEMLAAARRDYPAMRWEAGDIAEWSSAAGPVFDVVFSNAALQWVPDHAAVFPRLLGRARVLAAQMPAASDAPAQRLIRELAVSAAWRGRFGGPVADWHSHDPAFYYDVLSAAATRIDLWQTEYFHSVDGPEAIVEWYRGTGLRPFLRALAEADRPRFVAEYLDAIRPWYPARADGRVLFPFLRIFLVAYR